MLSAQALVLQRFFRMYFSLILRCEMCTKWLPVSTGVIVRDVELASSNRRMVSAPLGSDYCIPVL